MEAGGLQAIQDDFIAETGLEGFQFMVAIFEGATGDEADEDDCASYAEVLGDPQHPVFADGETLIAASTPMTGLTIPEFCAFAPDMTIIGCGQGHGLVEDILDEIRSHAGLR